MRDLSELAKYRLPKEELRIYGEYGDGGKGCFKVFVGGRSFFCIVSNGGGWDHVSVTPCNRKRQTCPTWEEMCEIKDLFFLPEECVVQYHPPKSDYVNMHPYCLHLWKPNGVEMPRPPAIFVGFKEGDGNG
ncbi:MAG: hypothetical protein IJX67_10895 [Oscillospiraceae bacterium]|nr:hypothetical protein [Oscillospiraceae bacterium]